MKLKCEQPTNKIYFHGRELTIELEKLEISSDKDSNIKLTNLDYDQEKLYYIVQMNRECSKGSMITLTVPFSGKIINKLFGFYQSSYFYNGQIYQ